MLTDLLTDTGVAGHPDSFFRQPSRGWWANYLNVSMDGWASGVEFSRSYLAAVLQEGAGGTPIFGMRLMWSQVSDLSNRLDYFYSRLSNDAKRFRAAFGPLQYIHLVREDHIAQAVSRLKAEQSGLWHIHADGSERERAKATRAPVYNAHSLSELVAEARRHNASWVTWFAKQEIQPLSISYESLSADPQGVLSKILSTLNLDPVIAERVEPRTAKLADRVSRAWIERFRNEKAG